MKLRYSVYGLLNWNIHMEYQLYYSQSIYSKPQSKSWNLGGPISESVYGLLNWNIHMEYQLYYSVFPFWTSVNRIFFTLASKKSGDVVPVWRAEKHIYNICRGVGVAYSHGASRVAHREWLSSATHGSSHSDRIFSAWDIFVQIDPFALLSTD